MQDTIPLWTASSTTAIQQRSSRCSKQLNLILSEHTPLNQLELKSPSSLDPDKTLGTPPTFINSIQTLLQYGSLPLMEEYSHGELWTFDRIVFMIPFYIFLFL